MVSNLTRASFLRVLQTLWSYVIITAARCALKIRRSSSVSSMAFSACFRSFRYTVKTVQEGAPPPYFPVVVPHTILSYIIRWRWHRFPGAMMHARAWIPISAPFSRPQTSKSWSSRTRWSVKSASDARVVHNRAKQSWMCCLVRMRFGKDSHLGVTGGTFRVFVQNRGRSGWFLASITVKRRHNPGKQADRAVLQMHLKRSTEPDFNYGYFGVSSVDLFIFLTLKKGMAP